MSRPTRPDWPAYPTIVTSPREEVKYLTGYIHDLLTYITAIEQERDEAVDIIRAIRDSGALDDLDPPGSEWFDESQWAVNRRVLAFLARVEGANDD